MKVVVVVGGGIAGVYAALLCREFGQEVVLVEASSRLGGLLNSIENENGDSFDFGTHMIAGTENPEIDRIILPKKFTEKLQKFEGEHAGHFFNGKLVDDCTFIHTQNLKSNEYVESVSDITALKKNNNEKNNFQNLGEQLQSFFGRGFTKNVLEPSMKKFCGVDRLSDLSTNSHLIFGMRRIVIETEERTRELKQDPFWDDRIAYHSFRDGASSSVQYYPFTGGAGEWIKFLKSQLLEQGVNIFTDTQVSGIDIDSGTVKSVELSNGEKFQVKDLVWTAPAALLALSANLNIKTSRTVIRQTKLVNFVFDQAPIPQCRYFICHDLKFLPFRITLYSNFQSEEAQKKKRYKLTVEVLNNEQMSDDELIEKLKVDLIDMNVIDQSAKTLFSEVLPVKSGFPVRTNEFVSNVKEIETLVDHNLKNIIRVGKSNSNTWFMRDIFKDIFRKVSSRYER